MDDSVIKFLKDCTTDKDFRIRANALEALDQLELKTDKEVLLKCKDEHNESLETHVSLFTIHIMMNFSISTELCVNLGALIEHHV